MSHRELPRSGRGCVAAVVGLPLAAAGGVAALVLAFDHPGPSPSAAPPVTVDRTLVSVRTEVRTVALPPVVVPATPAPRVWGTGWSPVPSPERREPRTSEDVPRPSTRAVGPRARVEPPSTEVGTTTESVPPATTEVPATTDVPATTTAGPTTGSGEQGVAPEAALADAGRDGEVT